MRMTRSLKTEQHLQLAREPHYGRLDPARVRLFDDGSGRLRMTVDNARSYIDVKVVRAFPFSEPDRYIGYLDGLGKSIGFVVDPAGLDPESARLTAEALRVHYFIPVIKAIDSLREEYGAVYFDVQTDCGPRHFVATGLRDAVIDLGGGELLVADVDGNRYRIHDWTRLDARSRSFLERVV
jgi:hypothetical protein